MGYGFLQTRHPPHPAAEADGGREHALQGTLCIMFVFERVL